MLFALVGCVGKLSHDSRPFHRRRASQYKSMWRVWMCMYVCVCLLSVFSSRKMVIKRFQLEVVVEGGKVCSTYIESTESIKLWEWVRPTFHIKVIKNDGEKSILQLFFSISFFFFFYTKYLLQTFNFIPIALINLFSRTRWI